MKQKDVILLKKRAPKDEVEPNCAYCIFAVEVVGEECILCPKKGIMQIGDACKKFVYDPLKKIPRKSPPPQVFQPGDFNLD